MATKRFGPRVSIERCIHCFGIWATARALSELNELAMSDVLDEGDARRGMRYDQITNIDCPSCGVRMLRETHPRQRHINYERCPNCSGYFLDAGEYRDIKHYTIGDWFKGLLRPR